MRCEKCRQERPIVRPYLFYYGNKGRSTTAYDFNQMQKVTSTPYTIAGQAGAQICDRCILRAQVLNILLGVLIAALFFVLSYGAFLEGNTANVFACSGIGLIFLFAIPIMAFRNRQDFGEKAAISVRRKELRAQKYNAFLTTAAYRKMREQ